MALADNLVDSLQKDHQELSDLAVSFRNALEAFDRKEVKVILGKIENLTRAHFKFEEDYLYPRMLRLTRQIAERLHDERQTINGFLAKSTGKLNMNRIRKNSLSSMSQMFPILFRHLSDCRDIVILANKFEDEEKNELNRKLNECRKRKKA